MASTRRRREILRRHPSRSGSPRSPQNPPEKHDRFLFQNSRQNSRLPSPAKFKCQHPHQISHQNPPPRPTFRKRVSHYPKKEYHGHAYETAKDSGLDSSASLRFFKSLLLYHCNISIQSTCKFKRVFGFNIPHSIFKSHIYF